MKTNELQSITPIISMLLIFAIDLTLILTTHQNWNTSMQKYVPLKDHIDRVNNDLAVGHLWLEEIIGGDQHVDVETQVWEPLEEAVQTNRDFVQSYEEIFDEPGDREMMGRLKQLQAPLEHFLKMAKTRFSDLDSYKIGSELDQVFDEKFNQMQQSIDTLNGMILTRLKDEFSQRNAYFKIIMALFVAVNAVIFTVLYLTKRAKEKYEHDLYEEKEKALVTLHSIGDAVVTTDRNGCIAFMNPIAERLTGWSEINARGKRARDVLHIAATSGRKNVEDPIGAVLRHRDVSGLTKPSKLTSRDGTIKQIESTGAPIHDRNGAARGVVLVFRDVTEKYEKDAEMNRLRNLLSNIINSMPSVLVGVDAEGKVIQWNEEAERVTGRRADEVENRRLSDVYPELSGEMERVRQAIERRTPQVNQKVPHQKNGETRFADITIYPLVTNGVEGAVIRVDDITKKIRIEELMIQSEKMISVGGLAAGMAHEINNPLAGILQNVQVIVNRTSSKEPKNRRTAEACGTSMEAIDAYLEKRGIKVMINAIFESGQRAAHIVHNMLSFARKGSGHHKSADIAALLDKTLELAANDYDLKKNYDFRQIQIVRDYAPDLPEVQCETNQIQQVFLNLLKNGAQAMIGNKSGGAPPTFVVRLRPEDNWLRMEFEDNGPGIDEATRKRIFEPFFTTKAVGMGTGLGLSLSYFIVTENHKGRLEVDSSPNTGTRFSLRLPLGEVAA